MDAVVPLSEQAETATRDDGDETQKNQVFHVAEQR